MGLFFSLSLPVICVNKRSLHYKCSLHYSEVCVNILVCIIITSFFILFCYCCCCCSALVSCVQQINFSIFGWISTKLHLNVIGTERFYRQDTLTVTQQTMSEH